MFFWEGKERKGSESDLVVLLIIVPFVSPLVLFVTFLPFPPISFPNEQFCLKNCTCMGYATADINNGGRGCITWYGDMIDTRTFSDGGQSLYIRVDAAELGTSSIILSN